MGLRECKFCTDLNDVKAIVRKYDKELNTKSHFKIKLFTYRTRDRKRMSMMGWSMYDINFCPVCGKKLTRSRKKEAANEDLN